MRDEETIYDDLVDLLRAQGAKDPERAAWAVLRVVGRY